MWKGFLFPSLPMVELATSSSLKASCPITQPKVNFKSRYYPRVRALLLKRFNTSSHLNTQTNITLQSTELFSKRRYSGDPITSLPRLISDWRKTTRNSIKSTHISYSSSRSSIITNWFMRKKDTIRFRFLTSSSVQMLVCRSEQKRPTQMKNANTLMLCKPSLIYMSGPIVRRRMKRMRTLHGIWRYTPLIRWRSLKILTKKIEKRLWKHRGNKLNRDEQRRHASHAKNISS